MHVRGLIEPCVQKKQFKARDLYLLGQLFKHQYQASCYPSSPSDHLQDRETLGPGIKRHTCHSAEAPQRAQSCMWATRACNDLALYSLSFCRAGGTLGTTDV